MLSYNEIDRGVRSVKAHLQNRQDLETVMSVINVGSFVAPLLLSASSTEGQAINNRLTRDLGIGKRRLITIQDDTTSYSYTGEKVREFLHTGRVQLPAALARHINGIIIGSGPAAIINGRLLNELGIRVNYVAHDEIPGGIWRRPVFEDDQVIIPAGEWGEEKRIGYNNPNPIRVFDARLPLTRDRETHVMQDFLDQIEDRDMRSRTIRGTAVGIEYHGTRPRVIYKKPNGTENVISGDFVIVATGNTPIPLDGGYMDINIPDTLPVRRWPSLLTYTEAKRMSDNGERIVAFEWGNSTMSKIREVEDLNKRYHLNLRVVVLSHQSPDALWHPHDRIEQLDGRRRSVARKIDEGEYTRLELDLAESRDIYRRNLAIEANSAGHVVSGTIPSVYACDFIPFGNSFYAEVFTVDDLEQENSFIVPNVGEVDAFIGFGNDPGLMQDFGFSVQEPYRGIVNTRFFDGKARSQDNRNLYAAGAAGFSRKYPSRRVIPGTIPQAAEIAVDVVLQAALKYAATTSHERSRKSRFFR
jgi:hypothetical protein